MHIQIIGLGKIGTLFAKILSKHYPLTLTNRTQNKEDLLKENLQIQESTQPINVSILAVKPQDLNKVALDFPIKEHLLISTLAGIPIKKLKKIYGSIPIFRITPNLTSEYGKGVIGIAKCEESLENKQLAEKIVSHFGRIYWIEEEKFNAFTSLSACGPAFVSLILEAMVDAGIATGFSAEYSLDLLTSMIEGTLTAIKQSGMHPAAFKNQICSPSGMTIEGIKALEKEKVRYGIIQAFIAAKQKGDLFEND